MRLGKFFIRLSIVSLWALLFFFLLTMPYILRPSQKEVPTLNIFSWPEVLSTQTIERFEKESGIKVRRHYYTSNEELFVKLQATQGKGYDLIIPSDYMVQKLIDEELLEPLDHSRLPFIEELNPRLLKQSFDPKNAYSIPFMWEVLGFGINRGDYETLPLNPTWKEIFCPTHPNARLSMVNDPIEAIDCTARHLFGQQTTFSPKEISHIQTTLQEQKLLVEAYAGVRGDYLLITKNCSLAVIPTSYVIRAAKHYPHIDLIVPKDYTFLSIENICIPKNSEGTEEAYAFLNYLYQNRNLAEEANTFYNFPPKADLQPYLETPEIYQKTLDQLENYEGELYFTRDLLSEKESRTLWINVKGS